MKNLIKLFILICLCSNSVLADCDYSKIIKNDDGSYTYSKELHICVGQMKQDLEISKQQNDKYVQALFLKDVSLEKADQRIDLWMQSSFKLEEKLSLIDKSKKDNEVLYFGLGMITMFAAAYSAAQFYRSK